MREDSCIVVPMDGSETSILAMDTALNLAQVLDVKIFFLHAAYFDSSTDDDSDSWLPDIVTVSVGDMIEDVRRVVEERLPKEIRAEFVERVGDPAKVVVDFAREKKAGLIVIGARGLSTMEGFFMGSVSQEVMETADCAVLIIKQQKEAFSW